jgi:hypothetical protein
MSPESKAMGKFLPEDGMIARKRKKGTTDFTEGTDGKEIPGRR